MSNSAVRHPPPLAPSEMLAVVKQQLARYADSSDLAHDLAAGVAGITVLDVRAASAYASRHIPGAINVPHRQLSAERTADWPRDHLYITYCDSIGCNGSTKGALALAALGFQVKELLGGVDGWARDGHDFVTGEDAGVFGTAAPDACGC